MKTQFIITAMVLLTLSSVNASAQNNRSLRDESQRIHQGKESGQLTALEAARLNTQKAKLKTEAIRYKTNDGHISKCERADLRKDNRQLSKNIYRQKHDRQRRG